MSVLTILKNTVGFLFDITEHLVWPLIRLSSGRGYYYRKYQNCGCFGNEQFHRLAEDAIKHLRSDSPELCEQILETPMDLVQVVGGVAYKRILNSRFSVPVWLENKGATGLSVAFVMSFLMHQEYSQMDFFRRYFVRPSVRSSLKAMREWVADKCSDPEILEHFGGTKDVTETNKSGLES